MVGLFSCTPPTKLIKHWFLNPGEHSPASSWLGPQGANICMYLSIQEVISLLQAFWDGRITKRLFINSCRPKLPALEWEGGNGSRSQGLTETFHADRDDRPQTLQALNQIKLQTCFPSSRCWPCTWLAPLKEAWGRGSFDCVLDLGHTSQIFPTATVSRLCYLLSTRGPVPIVWEVFKGLRYLRLEKQIY